MNKNKSKSTPRQTLAEDTLHNSEERYKAIFASIDEGFVINELLYDENGNPFDVRILETNLRFNELMHITDPVGKTAREIYPDVDNSWFEMYHEVISTGKAKRLEKYVGELDRWFELYMSRIGGEESHTLAIVFNDITGRKHHAEQQVYLLKLSDALRPFKDAAEIKTTAQKLLGEQLNVDRVMYAEYINKDNEDYWLVQNTYHKPGYPFPDGLYLLKGFGQLAYEIIKGKPIIVNDVMKEPTLSAEEKATYMAGPVAAFIALPLMKEDKFVAVLALHSATPRVWKKEEMELAEETAQRTWAAVERAKAEKELQEMNESLENLVQQRSKEIVIKNRQLESLHAELRTFNTIAATNYSETLRQLYTNLEFIVTNDARRLSDSGRANIRRAQSAIQRMKLLTEDLLAYSKLQQLDAESQYVELGPILHTVVADMEAKLKDYELQVNYTPVFVTGYPFLLSLVFYHLLDNAIKFRKINEAHRIIINFETFLDGANIPSDEAQPDMQYHCVSFIDTGIGFTAEQSKKIFDVFFRLHEKSRYKGSGIGLAICKKVMDMHGGFITAEGEPDAGASFRCYFPVTMQ